MKIKTILPLVLSLSVLNLFAASTSAKPIYHDVGTYEIEGFWVLNQCNGEWIICGGTIHYNVQLMVDSAGGLHWRWHANHNLRGECWTTGKKYQVVSTFTQHYNTKADGFPYEWTFVNTSPLISQGSVTNMIFTIRNQVTINANGETTVSFSDVQIVCRG